MGGRGSACGCSGFVLRRSSSVLACVLGWWVVKGCVHAEVCPRLCVWHVNNSGGGGGGNVKSFNCGAA